MEGNEFPVSRSIQTGTGQPIRSVVPSHPFFCKAPSCPRASAARSVVDRPVSHRVRPDGWFPEPVLRGTDGLPENHPRVPRNSAAWAQAEQLELDKVHTEARAQPPAGTTGLASLHRHFLSRPSSVAPATRPPRSGRWGAP